MDSFKDVLEAAQSYCKAQMAEPTYNLYIDGLEPISFEDSSHITLSVRNDFICKIVTDRYLGLLKEAFKTVLGFDVDITLVVPSTPPHEVVLAQQYEANPASPQGNYEFTFENFIKGPSNQFAFAAAQAVAANPSGAYNPLFIYGGSGLGKTHLLTAIQTEIKRTHPDFVIMYVTCEQFTNELIAAIRAGSTEDFRMKYRVADLLLVDDIQFIAGKESTQEEFFHTFNSLHDAHKQIVIASDRPAKEIKSLEERLRTRFEWGLTADVQPPDFETRVAIVKRKAELLHLDLPEDVAEFIANHLKITSASWKARSKSSTPTICSRASSRSSAWHRMPSRTSSTRPSPCLSPSRRSWARYPAPSMSPLPTSAAPSGTPMWPLPAAWPSISCARSPA